MTTRDPIATNLAAAAALHRAGKPNLAGIIEAGLQVLAAEAFDAMTIPTTPEQRASLLKVYQRNQEPPPFADFLATVEPGPDCIMVPWAGMWLGIEKDGYTHS